MKNVTKGLLILSGISIICATVMAIGGVDGWGWFLGVGGGLGFLGFLMEG